MVKPDVYWALWINDINKWRHICFEGQIKRHRVLTAAVLAHTILIVLKDVHCNCASLTNSKYLDYLISAL